MTLRDQMIAELNRVYFDKRRKGSMAEDMADAILKLLEKSK